MKMDYSVESEQIGALKIKVSLTMTFDEMETITGILDNAKDLTVEAQKAPAKLREILSEACNKISQGSEGSIIK